MSTIHDTDVFLEDGQRVAYRSVHGRGYRKIEIRQIGSGMVIAGIRPATARRSARTFTVQIVPNDILEFVLDTGYPRVLHDGPRDMELVGVHAACANPQLLIVIRTADGKTWGTALVTYEALQALGVTEGIPCLA